MCIRRSSAAARSDLGASIAVDSSGNNAYVTGQTSSSNFPTVVATQANLGGGNDAFVSEINSTGSALAFSTYLGGSLDEDDGGDYGAIAVDSAGANIYVTGNTASTNFPTQAPYQKAKAAAAPMPSWSNMRSTQRFSLAATTPAAVAPGTSGTSTVTLTAFQWVQFAGQPGL